MAFCKSIVVVLLKLDTNFTHVVVHTSQSNVANNIRIPRTRMDVPTMMLSKQVGQVRQARTGCSTRRARSAVRPSFPVRSARYLIMAAARVRTHHHPRQAQHRICLLLEVIILVAPMVGIW